MPRVELMAQLGIELMALIDVVRVPIIIPKKSIVVTKADERLLHRQVQMSRGTHLEAVAVLFKATGCRRGIAVVKPTNRRRNRPGTTTKLPSHLGVIGVEGGGAQRQDSRGSQDLLHIPAV